VRLSGVDRPAEPILVVLGEIVGLEGLVPADARVLRVRPTDLDRELTAVALAVLDARQYPLPILTKARRSARLGMVPTLILADDEDDPALADVGADDVVRPPFDRWVVAHRVRTLIELGRNRLMLRRSQRMPESALQDADSLEPDEQLEMERRRFERLAAMGTMVAGFAHEVRNPMASLRSIAESLNEELVEANVQLPHVGRMLKVLERVERLVRTSLLFGRPSPPRPSAHRPWSLLSAAVESVLPRTRALGGDLAIEADPGLPDVYVDDGQIVQALVILLNNALDATSSPRRVLLRAQYGRPAETRGRTSDVPPPPFVRFDVRDDGPGIPPDLVGRIFDPFFTTKASGTGLGLSIAQQLVTENAARIELKSSIGGPTTFSVLVPVALGPPPPPQV
jgi:signal transduction histidine kinase